MESNLVLDTKHPDGHEVLPSLFIRPPSGWASLGLRELWEYRELLYFLTWRDLKVRYKQTALGAAWAIIQPFFILLALATALGVGLWLSALNVQYRDVRYTIGFLAQLWLFATPVAYPSSIVPERWRWLYGLNPMAGVIEGFRWALLGKTGGPGAIVIVSVIAVVALLVGGLAYFRRMEKTFADLV